MCIIKVLHILSIQNRVSPKTLERLEPYVVKVTSTVLRGACELVTVLWGGNTPCLPDYASKEDNNI